MKGNDRVRYCGHCDLNVNNISALTRKQALRLVRRSEGRICVNYIKNPVDNTPLFADRLYQITRRAGIAAGVLSATLSFSALAYAQNEPVLNKRPQLEFSQPSDADPDRTGAKTASLAGFVTDPSGSVVPNIFVKLINEDTKETFALATDEKGAYKFENLAAGNYKMTVTGGPGFIAAEVSGVAVSEGRETRQDVSLTVEEIAIVDVTSEPTLNYEVLGGAIAITRYQSPLHEAVSSDEAEEVRNLIARGASVNQKDENYSHITPLFLAAENGNAEIAETLLSFGAKVNARDDNRQTPLMRLDEDASVELVNVLIKHGARINLFDKEGNTALILAARAVKAEVLQLLIDHSANLNAQNREGRTALMEAADADNLENVRALLVAGAAVDLTDKAGETAYDLTTDEEIEKLLVEYGAVQ
jgi:hypothetical protein